MIQNGQQDKKKPNYLFISSLNRSLKLNDCGHAHKSSQSCQKSKSNIVLHDNHPTTQVSIVQPLKRKETKHFLAHLCVFITYFLVNLPMGRCWCWCWGLHSLLCSLDVIQQEYLASPHQDHLAAASMQHSQGQAAGTPSPWHLTHPRPGPNQCWSEPSTIGQASALGSPLQVVQ